MVDRNILDKDICLNYRDTQLFNPNVFINVIIYVACYMKNNNRSCAQIFFDKLILLPQSAVAFLFQKIVKFIFFGVVNSTVPIAYSKCEILGRSIIRLECT